MAYFPQPAASGDRLRLAIRLVIATVLLAVVAIELDAIAVFLLLRTAR